MVKNIKFKCFTLSAIILGILIVSGTPVSADDSSSYSIMHISDTQKLSKNYPSTLNFTFSYLESIQSTFNISAIIITGDMVDNGDDVGQWENYINARSMTTIPIYEIPGNHDMRGGEKNPFYEEFVGNKTKWTSVINDFNFIGIGFNNQPLSDSDILYYRSIIEESPQKFTLIATHNYYNEDFTVSPLGESIKNNLVVKPTFVMSGHAHDSWVRSTLVNNFSYIVDLTNHQEDGDFSAGKLYTVSTTMGDVERVTVRDVGIFPCQYLGAEMTVYDRTGVNKNPGRAECPTITARLVHAEGCEMAARIESAVEKYYLIDSLEDYIEKQYVLDFLEDCIENRYLTNANAEERDTSLTAS